jgi:hypothetical protein
VVEAPPPVIVILLVTKSSSTMVQTRQRSKETGVQLRDIYVQHRRF